MRRENKQRERGKDKERKRDESQEGKGEGERKTKKEGEKEMGKRECGRKAGRANERGTVYLATGGTYRSICAQPLSIQTAYVDT